MSTTQLVHVENGGENKKKRKAPPAKAAPQSHPDCERCKKKPAPTRVNPWNQFLKAYIKSHPELTVEDAKIEARKRYVPANGRKKSFERIYKETFLARHPSFKFKGLQDEELRDVIRDSFLKESLAVKPVAQSS